MEMNHKKRQIQFGPSRQSIRLPAYDYAADGLYYITLCTQDRAPIFGDVEEGQMFLSLLGEMVDKTWLELPRYNPRLFLDEHQVMPDHFHGIIGLSGQAQGPNAAKLNHENSKMTTSPC